MIGKRASSIYFRRPTACVTRKWAGVDSVWEREKLEATQTA
jgi:hypothetical protein